MMDAMNDLSTLMLPQVLYLKRKRLAPRPSPLSPPETRASERLNLHLDYQINLLNVKHARVFVLTLTHEQSSTPVLCRLIIKSVPNPVLSPTIGCGQVNFVQYPYFKCLLFMEQMWQQLFMVVIKRFRSTLMLPQVSDLFQNDWPTDQPLIST